MERIVRSDLTEQAGLPVQSEQNGFTAPNEPTTQGDHHARSAVEVDVQATDTDSAYRDEISTYTASITSVVDYRHENGRRYHGYRDGTYLLPNDEAESDRLDMIHEMTLTIMGGKLFHAPIGPSPGRVIDLGTGTGIWAIEFADEHPHAEVIGNDLSPTQLPLTPSNLRFIVDDIESEWTYGTNTFDFIHARYLCYSIKDYRKLLRQCYAATRPGGWVEFQDWDAVAHSEDGTLTGTGLERYFVEFINAFENAGYATRPGPHLEEWLREAGFVDIHVLKYRVPIGAWPKDPYYKESGTWMLIQAVSGFKTAAMAVLTRFQNWKPDEVEVLSAQALNDAKSRRVHAMLDFYVVYGRKPE